MLPVKTKAMLTHKRLKQVFSKSEEYRRELTDYMLTEVREHGGAYQFREPPFIITDTGDYYTIVALEEMEKGLILDAGITYIIGRDVSLRNLVWLANAMMKNQPKTIAL